MESWVTRFFQSIFCLDSTSLRSYTFKSSNLSFYKFQNLSYLVCFSSGISVLKISSPNIKTDESVFNPHLTLLKINRSAYHNSIKYINKWNSVLLKFYKLNIFFFASNDKEWGDWTCNKVSKSKQQFSPIICERYKLCSKILIQEILNCNSKKSTKTVISFLFSIISLNIKFINQN